MAPLSAALANGDDTLSITADCYSTAGTDAAITAALLAYYTSAQVDALLGDYRTGAAQDAETTSAITAALLAYYTSAQVDALLGDYRTASAQDTQTQAAIAGALLAYRTGPDQDVFTTNQITSALVAYRSAADQDTATASSIAAALLSYYTIAQVDGLLAGKLGVAEAASALQIAVRFPDDGGADEVVARSWPPRRLAVKLDGSPQQRLQRGPGHAHRGRSERGRLHPDPGGEPVEHRAHLNRGELRSHRGAHGRHVDDHRAASTGPLDCESLDCTFTATSGGVSTGSVVCGDVTSSGTVSAPQLFASNTLIVTNTSDFSDDLFLTKNWAGWSKLQVSNNSAAPDSGPELRLLGNQSARVFLERDGGAHQCELIMINDEALVQTKSLHAAVPDHEPEEPRLPRDRGQHGQRGLQHELHEFVGQPGEDGDGGGRRGGAQAAL